MTEEILEEIDKLHKKQEGQVKRAVIDIDNKGHKSLQQLMDEEEHVLDQFAFLIIIANPMNQMVKVIVDDGFVSLTMRIEKLLNLVNTICGYDEMKKIRLCCQEYGVPYLYDREMKRVHQINERIIEERITAKKMKDDNEKELQEQRKDMNQNKVFENLREKMEHLLDKLPMNNAPSRQKSFRNYNRKENKRYY